jgi:hypothetical protein
MGPVGVNLVRQTLALGRDGAVWRASVINDVVCAKPAQWYGGVADWR